MQGHGKDFFFFPMSNGDHRRIWIKGVFWKQICVLKRSPRLAHGEWMRVWLIPVIYCVTSLWPSNLVGSSMHQCQYPTLNTWEGSLHSAFSWAAEGCSSADRYTPDMSLYTSPTNEGPDEWIDLQSPPPLEQQFWGTLCMAPERILSGTEPQLPTIVANYFANMYCFLPSLPYFLLYFTSASCARLPSQLPIPKSWSQVCFGWNWNQAREC